MARKGTDAATAASSRSSSKRAAPAIPSRQSKRAKAATRKSYIEPESDEDMDSTTTSRDDAKESEYDAENGTGGETEPEPDDEQVDSEDDGRLTKGAARGRHAKRTALPLHSKQRNEAELWKHGAEIAPGTQVIIKRPKARDAGSVPYADETIHPNTMLFLKDLAANNERQWLKGRVPSCLAARS